MNIAAKRTRTVNLSRQLVTAGYLGGRRAVRSTCLTPPAIRPSPRLLPSDMTVHLVNPSHLSFGVGVITPRRLFVLGAATPASYGSPLITDETLEPFDVGTVQPGDVVGVGIHTGNALP